MQLYNTLSGQLEPVTSDDNIFRMYVCGVTPYDTTHLGHAFTFVMFDVLERYLEYLGYETQTVQNVTDIDDDILRRARELSLPWNELAHQETEKYLADMRALNVRPPDHFVYATSVIEQIQAMVAALLEGGYAYASGGSVYYDVCSDPGFGKLGKMNYEDMLATANERGNFPDDPNKRDPLDFVLWQAAKPGEPTWDSPWGEGRPGWHIECSTMSTHYLGPKIDIHSGGEDLVFPHHDCEIVQSEHATGEHPFVRYWFHVAMVRLDGEKMSKSLGNMLFVGKLIETYSPDTLRVYLLTHHYRDAWSADGYEDDLKRIGALLKQWCEVLARPGEGEPFDASSYEADFRAAMDDDLHTAGAIEAMDALANAINAAALQGQDVIAAQNLLRTLGDTLGLRLDTQHPGCDELQ